MRSLGLFPLNSIWFFLLLVLLCSCKGEKNPRATLTETLDVSALDPHSYANFNELKTKHLSLELEVSFKHKTLYGIARHQVINHKAHKAVFDINGPLIQKVTLGPKGQETEADFVIGKMDKDSILGQPLIVTITPETEYINIYYQTGPNCRAIEWVNSNSEQDPFLYTQGQAILTRSWIPLQDAPSNRITYDASVQVSPGLLALMSAENPTTTNSEGKYRFAMRHPIPSYLIALTVGNIAYHPYSNRCGVYAPVHLLQAASVEFQELPEMLRVAEQLFGPYAWGRYDLMVQHPSFPFGGMENPCLTFINPAIVAGDKSLVSVVAHELAHSWSGNLVTNETWNDFWLNEGFTVFVEHRIMEEMHGKEYSNMLSELEWNELNEELMFIKKSNHPEDAALYLHLKNRDPDEGMTTVAYVKGAYFLKTLEHRVGRKHFDTFLSLYFSKHRFQSMSTQKFTTYLKEKLLKPDFTTFDYLSWIFEPGIPKNVYFQASQRLSFMRTLAQKTNAGEDIFKPQKTVTWVKVPGRTKKRKKIKVVRLKPEDYCTQEWIMYLRNLTQTLPLKTLRSIDRNAHFSQANREIQFEWYMLNLRCNQWSIAPELQQFLQSTGRRKYVLPLFKAVIADSTRLDWAKEVFTKSKNNYHSVTRKSVELLLK